MIVNSTIDPKLYEAAREGNIVLLEQLLGPDVPLQQQDGQGACLSGLTYTGDTALHIAAYFGQIEVARRVCEVNRSLLMKTNNKLETPLHYAAQFGNVKLVGLFIKLAREEGDDNFLKKWLRKRNQNGETALYHAVSHEQIQVAERLMQEDPHLAGISDKLNVSPLYLAVTLSSFPLVECLVDLLPMDVSHGAYEGPNQQNALHAAALKENGIFDRVLNSKPELAKGIDASGRTPLHYAASVNNFVVVEALLDGARTSAYTADSCGLFPVHIAAKSSQLEVLRELLQYCPDSGELLDHHGRNFLHLAVKRKNLDILRWTCNEINSDKVLNAQDNEGNTPLHLAVIARNTSVLCSLLITKRVHLNWPNKNGLTALDIAHAQMLNGFSLWQNLDYAIYQTLYRIGCTHGTYRTYHPVEGNKQLEDEGKKKHDVESSTKNMAKSISICSILIAATTCAVAFAGSESDVLISNKGMYNSRQLNHYFMLFAITVIAAFLCSAIATAQLAQTALNSQKPRELKLFRHAAEIVMLAAKFFLMAFATGSYVILTPLNELLAVIIACLVGLGQLTLYFPWWNISLTRTIINYNGYWRALLGPVPLSNEISGKSLQYTGILYIILETCLHWGMLLFLVDVSLATILESTFRTIMQAVTSTAIIAICCGLHFSEMTRVTAPF